MVDKGRLAAFFAGLGIFVVAAVWLFHRACRSWRLIDGWKVYIICASYITYKGLGFAFGDVSGHELTNSVFEGVGGMALRQGVKKSGPSLQLPQNKTPTVKGDG